MGVNHLTPILGNPPTPILLTSRNRRLQLLRVLVERPNVLILDEPTNDLDAVTRQWQKNDEELMEVVLKNSR